ncbi:hypothetical protein PM082_022169 [Marasmius tenuissimus]|nr:hypothetical protein PM082_022169 [Marasmius tenuissimus]
MGSGTCIGVGGGALWKHDSNRLQGIVKSVTKMGTIVMDWEKMPPKSGETHQSDGVQASPDHLDLTPKSKTSRLRWLVQVLVLPQQRRSKIVLSCRLPFLPTVVGTGASDAFKSAERKFNEIYGGFSPQTCETYVGDKTDDGK